ncbi:23S rRNA (uracil1939-C5)-methyltransferase [Pseudoalteromonas ulvae UL12]|uniref:23S rRNA (uracil(1939)-C(5))-methyltransferase RlmD n=1 Tax=Pseudoalteromonas ulvae TaxID=107327 RepID=A0A244CSP3_PSEDV|nr:23S rRNA (uracil(1939)-C(5))-methyltransferase RlmD [Pseudoalteromonas ulvae]MBE0363784.1 23S rRNA (uracil1939-C5)-methyltransferase [Pseudoalteromonas ulvae UL12]OUL58624.1 23S rRNA (uracil(1939)-C(5))-methyltransferase [Pseudoalteromonas ulvae]
MAQFFKPQKATQTQAQRRLTISSLDHEGVGVTRDKNKVCFVEGALTGETVLAKPLQSKAKFERLVTSKVLTPSPYREAPFCDHYGVCGGCQLQHLQLSQQLIEKQHAVSQLFAKFAKIEQLNWQEPLSSQPLHYRRSARVAVFYDKHTRTFNIGFRRKGSKKVVDIKTCPILDERFSSIFTEFRALLPTLKQGSAITHLQLCAANHAYLVVRHIKALPEKDIDALKALCQQHDWSLMLQAESGQYLLGELTQPAYHLSELDLTLEFNLDNFVQVNDVVNQKMLSQAINWLALEKHEKVLDLFCGIGNFSLAMARHAQSVVGIEGVHSSVTMAEHNAELNQISNAQFICQDLSLDMRSNEWFKQPFDVLVLDPSRGGAFDILQQLKLKRFKRILYVSCDPVTLARDSQLISAAGFEQQKIALMNMFPHTGHIETMALYVKR